MRPRAGRILERGVVPCSHCMRPHHGRVVRLGAEGPLLSWEQGGHAYAPMTPEQICRSYKLRRVRDAWGKRV